MLATCLTTVPTLLVIHILLVLAVLEGVASLATLAVPDGPSRDNINNLARNDEMIEKTTSGKTATEDIKGIQKLYIYFSYGGFFQVCRQFSNFNLLEVRAATWLSF